MAKKSICIMALEISRFGWWAGCYNNVESTDKHLKLSYAIEALESLSKIREMDEKTYVQLRTDYQSTLIEMISAIKNYCKTKETYVE